MKGSGQPQEIRMPRSAVKVKSDFTTNRYGAEIEIGSFPREPLQCETVNKYSIQSPSESDTSSDFYWKIETDCPGQTPTGQGWRV